MARRFVALGNRVIVTGRDRSKLAKLQQDLPQIHTFACDLAYEKELDELVLYLEKNHPDLNVLVNNAAIQYNYDFTDEKELVYKIAYEVKTNLTAPLKLIGLLLPQLLHNPEPAIVNVSTGLIFAPKKSAAVYCGTKAGLHTFTKALRYQLEGKAKVFEVIPPLVDTPMTAGRGTGKIAPEQLVEEFVEAFRRDKCEISIGKTKLLRFLQRLAPSVADRIMKNK